MDLLISIGASVAWAAFWGLAKPVLVGLVCWAATALINYALWWGDREDWDAWSVRHPRWALAVRVLRLVGPHLRPLVEAWSKYLRDKAAQNLPSGPGSSGSRTP